MTNDDDCAADARAAEVLGYTEVTWFDNETMWARNAHGWRAVARPSISPAIAHQLVAALPEERREAFAEALRKEIPPRVMYPYEWLIATATPRQLRDAVLEAMEER